MKIPIYKKKDWQKKDFLLYTYLNNIEKGIENLGKYYYKPNGWRNSKKWGKAMGFSYNDVNRWINNLGLIERWIENESSTLLPNETLYPNENLLPH